MNKKQILFSALFLTFACASAGAVPPEPSALSAFCPPSEGKAFHSEWISLGLKAADLKEKQASAGHITDVGEAQIQLHFPAGWSPQDKRTALCIFPGGGYAIQAIEKEGSRIAGWAAEHDMVGVVVKYRVSGTGNALGKFPGPLLDARQALRTVRKNASSLGIDPLRIGVMGFSAGGHGLYAVEPHPAGRSGKSAEKHFRPSGFFHVYLSRHYHGAPYYPRGNAQQNIGGPSIPCPGGDVFRGETGDGAGAAGVPRPRSG
jgi:hypothetical protein